MSNPNIVTFFRDPRSAPTTPDDFSQLYLLRRDIDVCFGVDPNSGAINPNWPKAIFPGVMAILAGIDLLAKFLAGNDAQNQVGIRFKQFLSQHFSLTGNDPETIWQLRNSLLHSYGLYAEKDNRIYRFNLSEGQPQLIAEIPSVGFVIDVKRLHSQFEIAVGNYLTALQNTSGPDQPQLDANFITMFDKHRLIRIG